MVTHRLSRSLVASVLLSCAGHPAPSSLPARLLDETAPFTVDIERLARSETDRRLITLAEAHQCCGTSLTGDQWWHATFDGTKIPRAITNEAVSYYLSKIDDFENGRWFTTSNGIEMLGASFEYRATVEPVELKGKPAYRVSLILKWSQHCADLCGLGFTKERRLWLTPAGQVIQVEGDGPSDYVVS